MRHTKGRLYLALSLMRSGFVVGMYIASFPPLSAHLSVFSIQHHPLPMFISFSPTDQPAGKLNYVGCYKDAGNRAIVGLWFDSKDLTNTKCIAICKELVRCLSNIFHSMFFFNISKIKFNFGLSHSITLSCWTMFPIATFCHIFREIVQCTFSL